MFKRIPSARTKADNNMQPIAPTSSPTIGNTLVVRSCSLSLANYKLYYRTFLFFFSSLL